jgi:hypothetical protein
MLSQNNALEVKVLEYFKYLPLVVAPTSLGHQLAAGTGVKVQQPVAAVEQQHVSLLSNGQLLILGGVTK